MKRAPRTLALSVLLFLQPALLAPAFAAGQQEQLHTASPVELGCVKVLLAQERAWNQGDIESFAKAYKNSPDTLFISREINRGFAGLLQSYRRDYPTKAAMGTLSFTDLEVHPLDEHFAVALGKYHLVRNKKEGGNAEGVFSLIMEKTAEGWRIVVDHTT